MRVNFISAAFAFALGAAAIAVSAEGFDTSRTDTYRQLELFGDVLSRVESDYVTEVDDAALIEAAIRRGEGHLGLGGAFLVTTGAKTGRSPKDKFVVRDGIVEDHVWWDNNKPMAPDAFDRLYADMLDHMKGKEYFVQDLYAGADPEQRLDVRVVSELAWHNLFIRHLLRRPDSSELAGFKADWTIVNCPSFKADPVRHGTRTDTVIALNFAEKLILIANTGYSGENKKSVFTPLNCILPERGVMPMHCSANHAIGDENDVAVFFGLSGTGKTTLSADPARIMSRASCMP